MNTEDVADLAHRISTAGWWISFASWFAASGFGALLGFVFVVAGFGMNWYYKAKRDRREQAEHEKRMAHGSDS